MVTTNNTDVEAPRERLVTKIGELLGNRAGADLVYAKPIERDGATIVPVAKVRFGFGGGGGQKPDQRGAGGGGGLVAEPAGFVVARGDEIRFEPIRDPVRIAYGVAAIALAGSWLVRAVGRLLTSRRR
jgi:uncharacterized spore protein YtfJ